MIKIESNLLQNQKKLKAWKLGKIGSRYHK